MPDVCNRVEIKMTEDDEYRSLKWPRFITCSRPSDRSVTNSVKKKLLLTETTTGFSIFERRSPLAREILLCEQRPTNHRRVPKNNYIF